ncbi:MAG: flagellar FliJ family protein [Planctomycetes bacterium]|nr:flagellar FliJ family protein [Planctomycetota bacterium]
MAKRFRFSLETLLRVRDVREREARRKVGLKQAEIARLDQLNRQTADEISVRQRGLRQQQQGALTPENLVRERAWIAYLWRTIVERQTQRAGLVSELRELQEAWRQARRQKRIIEKLRERRWQQYFKDRKRQEQAESDELARQLHAHGMAN